MFLHDLNQLKFAEFPPETNSNSNSNLSLILNTNFENSFIFSSVGMIPPKHLKFVPIPLKFIFFSLKISSTKHSILNIFIPSLKSPISTIRIILCIFFCLMASFESILMVFNSEFRL